MNRSRGRGAVPLGAVWGDRWRNVAGLVAVSATVAAACGGGRSAKSAGSPSPTSAGATAVVAAASPAPATATANGAAGAPSAPALVATSVDYTAVARSSLNAVMAALPARTCLVVKRGSEVLFDARGDLALTPASNAKVLMAFAVLANLDPSYRFRTLVKARTAPQSGVVNSDLYLIGSGDPLLMTADYAATYERPPEPRTSMEQLADSVVAAGVREIRGAIVGDETLYDKARAVPSWPPRYITNRESGPLSALTVNNGFVGFKEKAVPVTDPAQHGAKVLSDLLAARGVTITGAARSGVTPAGSVDVAAIESGPLREIVSQSLRDSDNMTAELLTKELGRMRGGAPTTAAGTTVIASTLERAGVPSTGLHVYDGSGLDPKNTATCRAMVATLELSGLRSDLGKGLPIAGETGTLKKRYADTPMVGRMIAKTGSINGVVTLSGFVPADTGEPFTFAFMVNGNEAVNVAYPAWSAIVDALLAIH